MDLNKIAPFFCGWNETLIWSCLQGCMGYAIADDEQNPSAAQIIVGDFCFFAGKPNETLVKKASAPIIIPQNEEWGKLIENIWGNRVKKDLRYAIKKEPDVFDVEKLTRYAISRDQEYEVKLFDQQIYEQAINEDWSKDLCSQFADYQDYSNRGLGVAILHQGKLVAGASSYTVYRDGIEIEIDTKPEYRQIGLATACGAKLILECLNRGLYPSWDAHDLRSVALAEKLGYHLDKPYIIYMML
jgi:GNAT superfamily N-acetyltransferase